MSGILHTEDGADRRHHVVVIGSGFGGLTAAKALRNAPVDVTMIARTQHHLFQPLLYQVATGILSEGEIAPATRRILRHQRNAEVLLGDVVEINLAGRYVVSELLGQRYQTAYDSLIVAAGAAQSYFGNDHFAEFAPGMKTIDDALEVRGRILGAFELAERSSDPILREKLLTFTVVGAGPTGVELAGQIAELATQTLKGEFRRIDSTQARVILLDAGSAVLAPMGANLGAKARARLQKMGVEIQLGARVVDVDWEGLTVKDSDGTTRRIESACKVWSAGVSASPLGKQIAAQAGAEVDRAGRIKVSPDLTVPGYPNVFVIGDMASVPGVPGMAQGAIQGAKHAAGAISAELEGATPAVREPFHYFGKGSMATVSRHSAVAKVGPLELSGYVAWVAWLALHLVYLVGFKSKIITLISWTTTFLTMSRGQLSITGRQARVPWRAPPNPIQRSTPHNDMREQEMSFNVPTDFPSRPVAVIGAGTLGRRIALMFAAHGAEVRIYDLAEAQRDAALDFVSQNLPALAEGLTGSVPGQVSAEADLAEAVHDAWLVIEAIPERLELKKQVFGQLDELAPADAILASNSSSYASRMFLDKVHHPERVLNIHFYMPPKQNAVDVMSCGKTDRDVIDFVLATLPQFGLYPFEARRESTGFIFNRVWAAVKRESLEVVAEGVSTPQDVDQMFQLNTGSAGPFRMMDQVGLDVVLDIEEHYCAEHPEYPEGPRRLLRTYIQQGRLGVKSGAGFYDDYPHPTG